MASRSQCFLHSHYFQLIQRRVANFNIILQQVFVFNCTFFSNRKEDLESHERSENEDSGDLSEEEEEEEEVGLNKSKT